jgi:DNA-directed RNA polymerase subunit M/transcription elongation factor TFIIS
MRKCSKCGNAPIGPNVKFCNKCGSAEIFDTEGKVSEYKRTCNQCGTVWHSLTSREAEINKGIKNLKSAECCNMCDQNARNRASSNMATYKSELERLKECPKCHSRNYSEDEITYDKK